MSETALISIITPTFNSEDFINHSIQSVVKQTFVDWELIIIDDASSDGTRELTRSWQTKDCRIRLIKNNTNLGPGPSRNIGVYHSKGRYLAYLDSDDIWADEKLEVQLAHQQKKKTALSFTSYEMMDVNGKLLNRTVRAPNSINYDQLLRNTIIGCSTVMIDRNLIPVPEMPAIPFRQPLVLWLNILRKSGPAYGVDEILAKYRVRSGSVSSNKLAAAKQVWNVYREYENLPFFKTFCCFCQYAARGYLRNRGLKR